MCAVRVIVSLLFVSDINESDLSECELLSTVAVSNHSSESRVCVCVCVCVCQTSHWSDIMRDPAERGDH